ncbi:hypothetical protein AGABI2DRAFT_193813 [Agaricus bisporus var. bisporus H97]|uniref:hypothetical protein n=1 Tax=Agaricus bisporus var. bisporus (strain H97 / ATCC MYA-4626 / FGSC 10389) TaxID=936046 RepID=UPI00029F4E9B|nr:hypothetical protein AGABI2DRAFT_193813 [Agaricus bisporus var. bisporus H97]EKV45889.1 hypothetical protein AGABI2DRAFT_193813 [Agaricus bisporus var. bisporus H97]
MSDIEDDAGTSRQIKDDVEDSDGEPVSRKRVKKGGKGKRSARKEAEDNDSDEAIEVTNFPDQPLKRDQIGKLLGLAEDWEKVADIIKRPFPKYGMAAGGLADLGDEDAIEKVDEIDGYMRESLDVIGVIKAHANALNVIRQSGLQGQDIEQVEALYAKTAKTTVADYKKKTTRQKYAKEEAYVAFKSSIWESKHPGIPMPPITEQIPREKADNSDEDDELEIGGVTQNYLCPLTLTLLADPYTSIACGHSFSAAAITATFGGSNGLRKCPAAGCNKQFSLAHCKPDKDLAKKVKAYKRRMERNREDSDAEEVVD